MFAVGRDLLPHSPVAVAPAEAFSRVESKLAFARSIDELDLPQPAWHPVARAEDLDALGFPVWVKAAFSTAGRGVRHARDHRMARMHGQRVERGDDPGVGGRHVRPGAGPVRSRSIVLRVV